MFSFFSSPKQERLNQEPPKNIDEFLNNYFNANLSEAKYINFFEFLRNKPSVPQSSFSEIISWLSHNIQTKLDKALEKTKPDSSLKEFLPIEILKLSSFDLTPQNVQVLSNCLRNSITIKEVYLDKCNIGDEQVKVLADIFRSNTTITMLSLSHNPGITNIGIKILLKIKEYNKTLENVRIQIFPENDASYQIVNIFQRDNKVEQSPLFFNTEILSISPNVKSILESMAENYNEITGKGKTDNIFVVAGLRGSGKTVTCYGLSELIKLIANNKYQVETGDETLNLKILHPDSDLDIAKAAKINNYTKVNNFITSKEDTKIIEFPGISLTNNISDDQKNINIFSNAYSSWQISKSGKFIKFLILLNGYSEDKFVYTIRQFIEIFKNKEGKLNIDLKNSMSLIFIDNFGNDNKTKTAKTNNIKNTLQGFSKPDSVFSQDYEQAIIKSLVENIVFINHPQQEGDFSEIPNFSKFEKLTAVKIANICVDSQKIAPSKHILTAEICEQIYANVKTIANIIQSFFEFNQNRIINPFKSFYKLDLCTELYSQMFQDNYNQIKHCLLKNPLNKSNALLPPQTSFHALSEIEELKNIYDKRYDVTTICSFLEIIRKFCSGDNKEINQDKLGDYIYVLKQQVEAIFFCFKLYPSYGHQDPLANLMKTAEKILITENLLDKAILDIKLKPYEDSRDITVNQTKFNYYEEAID